MTELSDNDWVHSPSNMLTCVDIWVGVGDAWSAEIVFGILSCLLVIGRDVVNLKQ